MSRSDNTTDEVLARIREDIIMGRAPDSAQDTRFKLGQSGNPRGRPRRADSSALSLVDQPTKLALIKASRQKLQVREGDRIVEMDAKTALVRAAHQTALKGSPYMQHRLLELNMKIDREEAREREESRRFWREYQERCYELFEAEHKIGKQLSSILPHPSDIIIDLSGKIRFVGPMDEAGQKAMEQTIAMRDLLILQEEWDCRSRPAPSGPRDRFIGSAYLFAFLLDKGLPPRLQLTEIDWCMAGQRAFCRPTRALLKTLYRGWRALGVSFPRGHRFPDRERVEQLVKFVLAVGPRFSVDEAFDMPEARLQEAFTELMDEHGLVERQSL